MLAYQSAFDSIKKSVSEALILAYYNQNIISNIEINLSVFVIRGVFSQLNDDRLIYLITFFSRNLYPTK